MSEVLYERIKENLEVLKIKHTLETIDNYLEMAIKDELNIVDVLEHIFTEEARSKRQRAYEKQIQNIQGANLFFQLIAKRYEKAATILTSNKTFSQ